MVILPFFVYNYGCHRKNGLLAAAEQAGPGGAQQRAQARAMTCGDYYFKRIIIFYVKINVCAYYDFNCRGYYFGLY